jgi:hypothetical protein
MVRINSQYGFGLVLGAGIVLAVAACGGDDDDDDGAKVSASADGKTVTAGVDAKSAQLALDELTTNVDTTITGFSSSNPAAPAGAAAASSDSPAINVSCEAGGDANIGGYVNIVPVPVNVDVKVAIKYDACITRTGTTISGELEFSQSVAAGVGTPFRVETLYSGNVTLAGAVNAKCAVDLNVLVDEAGNAVEVGGTFCGQDAKALNLKIMPRWSASASVSAR